MGKTEKSRKTREDKNTSNKRSKEKPNVGSDVVESICEKIEDAEIFPLFDCSLLERVAYFESRYGLASGEPSGGIWRVKKELFWDTQLVEFHSVLTEYFARIYKAFQINWAKVEWKEIQQPLYSALAAGLLMTICSYGVLPRKGRVGLMLEEQAVFWKKTFYSSERKNYRQKELVEDFISVVNENENKRGFVPFVIRLHTRNTDVLRKSSYSELMRKPREADMTESASPTYDCETDSVDVSKCDPFLKKTNRKSGENPGKVSLNDKRQRTISKERERSTDCRASNEHQDSHKRRDKGYPFEEDRHIARKSQTDQRKDVVDVKCKNTCKTDDGCVDMKRSKPLAEKKGKQHSGMKNKRDCAEEERISKRYTDKNGSEDLVKKGRQREHPDKNRQKNIPMKEDKGKYPDKKRQKDLPVKESEENHLHKKTMRDRKHFDALNVDGRGLPEMDRKGNGVSEKVSNGNEDLNNSTKDSKGNPTDKKVSDVYSKEKTGHSAGKSIDAGRFTKHRGDVSKKSIMKHCCNQEAFKCSCVHGDEGKIPTEMKANKMSARKEKDLCSPAPASRLNTSVKSEKATANSKKATTKPEKGTTNSEQAISNSEPTTTISKQATTMSEKATANSKKATTKPEKGTTNSEQAITNSEPTTTTSKQATTMSEKANTYSEKATTKPEKATTKIIVVKVGSSAPQPKGKQKVQDEETTLLSDGDEEGGRRKPRSSKTEPKTTPQSSLKASADPIKYGGAGFKLTPISVKDFKQHRKGRHTATQGRQPHKTDSTQKQKPSRPPLPPSLFNKKSKQNGPKKQQNKKSGKSSQKSAKESQEKSKEALNSGIDDAHDPSEHDSHSEPDGSHNSNSEPESSEGEHSSAPSVEQDNSDHDLDEMPSDGDLRKSASEGDDQAQELEGGPSMEEQGGESREQSRFDSSGQHESMSVDDVNDSDEHTGSEEVRSDSEEQASVSRSSSTGSNDSTNPSNEYVSPSEEHAQSESESRNSESEEHMSGSEEHTSNSEEHTSDSEEHTSDSEEHTSDSEEHTSDSEEHTSHAEEHASDSEEHTSDSEEHTSDSEEHTSDSEEHTSDSEEHTSHAEEHASDSEEHTSDSEEHTSGSEESTSDSNSSGLNSSGSDSSDSDSSDSDSSDSDSSDSDSSDSDSSDSDSSDSDTSDSDSSDSDSSDSDTSDSDTSDSGSSDSDDESDDTSEDLSDDTDFSDDDCSDDYDDCDDYSGNDGCDDDFDDD